MVCGGGGSLEGENESVWWSEMKPCFIIADTSLDFNAFSAAAAAIQSLEREREKGGGEAPEIGIFSGKLERENE